MARRGALLLDRRGNTSGVVRDFLHALADAADRCHRARGRGLHGQYLTDDRLGRLAGLHRRRFDLRGDHREAAPRLAGARRFDGSVERQEVRLLGNGLNELDDVADVLRRCRERRVRSVQPGFATLADTLYMRRNGLLQMTSRDLLSNCTGPATCGRAQT